MTVTFVSLMGLLMPHLVQNWYKNGQPLFQSSPHISKFVIAVYSRLSLDGVPQRFVQCGKIRTMVYAGQGDGV